MGPEEVDVAITCNGSAMTLDGDKSAAAPVNKLPITRIAGCFNIARRLAVTPPRPGFGA
jgi:hypothetical protein